MVTAPQTTRHGSGARASLAADTVVVFVGGAAGTFARYGVALAVPVREGWPLATLTVNVVGAFLLGLLLEGLARAGPENPARRRWRLLLGTGVLGGFTTYSSLAVETERLLASGRAGLAVGYALTSLVVGLAAAAAGVAVAARGRRWRQGGEAIDPDPGGGR